MMHVGEGTLLAFVDGELRDEEREAVGRHLAGCSTCSAILDELRAAALELTTALGLGDLDAPTGEAYGSLRSAVPAGSRPRPLQITPGGAVVRHAASTRRALLRAAMLVLGLAATASAAIPGSPVREWLVDTWRSLTGASAPVAVTPVEPAPPAEAVSRVASVSILPSNGSARILLTQGAQDVVVRVRVVDGEKLTVYASGAAADAHFATAPGRVTIAGASGGEIRVDLPRSLQSARVEAAGRLLLTSQDGTLQAHAPVSDSVDGELSFRVGG